MNKSGIRYCLKLTYPTAFYIVSRVNIVMDGTENISIIVKFMIVREKRTFDYRCREMIMPSTVFLG